MRFRELHDNCAGRRTRSKDTWLIQYEAIKKGYGFFITGYRDAEMVTGGVFNLTITMHIMARRHHEGRCLTSQCFMR